MTTSQKNDTDFETVDPPTVEAVAQVKPEDIFQMAALELRQNSFAHGLGFGLGLGVCVCGTVVFLGYYTVYLNAQLN